MSYSSTSHRWKHDVFASFRGPDVRKTFTSHLFKQLKRENISYFQDCGEENTGKKLEAIFEAIRHAKIALVVFSKTYADSKWCLNELVKIVNCKMDHNLLVIPIFLIPASDVKRWARESAFQQALMYLAVKERDNKQKEWKVALEEASSILGIKLSDTNGDEAMLVERIVKRVVEEIRQIRPLSFLQGIIPVDHFADDVISLLCKGGKEGVRMVGIWGPEGIGKTTVAGVAFDRIRGKFQLPRFVLKIGEENESDRPNDLRRELLKTLGGEDCSNIICSLTDKIKDRMRGKKILLVLDGVTNKKQVEEFGVMERTDREKMENGSRILITTRDLDLLTDLGVDDKYIVNGLSQDQALELFCRDAFKKEGREQVHDESDLSKNLSHYAGGHPLLLRALGSYVRDQPLGHWRTTRDKLVRSASSLFLPLQSVGLCEGQAGGVGAHDHATYARVRQSSVRIEPVIDPSTIDSSKDRCLSCSFEHGELPHDKIILVKPDSPNVYRTVVIDVIGGADVGLSSRAYSFKAVGPFGVVDGKNSWQDNGYTDVREIVVYVGFDPKAVKSISIIYDKNGRPSDPVTHGTTEGNEPHAIKLDYPREYLTTISGFIEDDFGLTILRSLTIITNVGRYGPYGRKRGKDFSFPYTGGKIFGFHGSCNGSDHLESIGAFYKPIPHTYPAKIFGPFGSEGKKFWDYNDIKGIDACYADFIMSIVFEVDDATSSKPKTCYDKNRKQHTFKVKLKNGEYITSFAGYRGDGINSLTFQTNKRILGPIGREEGVHFSLPSEAGKVTRLFGRSDDYCLKSIGAQVEPYYPFESVGPFGWESGSEWDDGNQYSSVKGIAVELYSIQKEKEKVTFIHSITFQYINEEDGLSRKMHSGIDANELPEASTVEIELDRDEYLTSISGYIGEGTFGLTSLTFQTNKKTCNPIGDEKGRHFSSPTTGGKIVGFYGRSGEHLNAIGAHFKPISHLYPVKSIGPFGGTSGSSWDDGKFDGVKKISVTHNPDIHYIKFVYEKSGEEVPSDTHGCPTKEALAKLEEFSLDYPREYLTSISGYKQEDGAIIQSLTFYTNKRKFGPFGKEKGKYFWYPSTGSRIIGFYGRCGNKLNAIGVYAEPVPHMYPFKIIGPFGGSGGAPWDDGVHTDVRGFYISCDNAIHSIKIVYDNNGSFVEGSIHGGGEGPSPMKLWLDYPKERLVSISVWRDASGNTSPIRNLEIVTTKSTYGPWGGTSGLEKFFIPPESDGGRIVGFFGSAGSCLDSIGAHLESY